MVQLVLNAVLLVVLLASWRREMLFNSYQNSGKTCMVCTVDYVICSSVLYPATILTPHNAKH